ncbi:MAG: ABC transporter permease [Actinobacteria bacterium]|nr:MAG: ABC transporter permease [Actinomycetota bacterium]
MRAKYVLSEVVLGLWRNVTMTIAMIITMAVSLSMLGASGLMYLQVNKMKEQYYGELNVAIFLDDEITEERRAELDAELRADPLVREVLFETKEMAYDKFKELYRDAPELVNAIKPEQLPQSFRVKLKDPTQYNQIFEKYKDAEGIDEIIDQRRLLEKIFKILNAIQNLALVAALVMAFAALLLVGNTIQVAAYSKRREVAVMKLVGAPNWFVQAPFVLEAVVAGLIGAILGFAALALAKIFLLDGALRDLTDLLTPLLWNEVLLMFPVMAGAGAFVSAVTAWITLRFYLRV